MSHPTAELLQAMAQVGLHPGRIHWDGKWHRFPGIDQERGDNGRYKAFVDQRNAIFMDMRTKEQWRWPQDNPAWRDKMRHVEPLSAEEVRKAKEKAAAITAKQAKIHTKRIRDLWQRATPVLDKGHPYLDGKDIRKVPVLRSIIDPEREEDMLLIPMKDRDGNIQCLQRIWPNGDRKYMAQAAGTRGLYDVIGSRRYMETKTLYLVEGWATGWSVHKATDCAVIVCFFDGGLLTVGKIFREKYAEARLIFAADNDRWKPVKRGGAMVNPGVYAARRAAKELNAEYCIPDFPAESLDQKPTDYDDLRQLTDLDEVRRWLDPAMAPEAVTMLPPDESREAEPEPVPDSAHDPEPESKLEPGSEIDSRSLPEAQSIALAEHPETQGDPLQGLMPELADLARRVGEDGWEPEHIEKLAELRFAARELDVEGPAAPSLDGKSPREALAVLEAHATKHGPQSDATFDADGVPRGLLTGDEWSKDAPPVRWAVKGWATAGTVIYLAGRGATGKTPFAAQLALAFAAGKTEIIPVAHDDSEAPQLPTGAKPRTAVFVGWESHGDDMMRIRAAIEKCGGPTPDDLGDRFKFLPAGQRGLGPMWAPGKDGSGHVATRAQPTPNGEKIMAWLNTIPDLGLVVFDPVASCFASDENSRALVREFLDWLAAFAANHPARPLVMLVGHPAKARAGEAADYSGSTDWRNACRAMWLLRRRTAAGYQKPAEGESRDFMSLALNKLNAPSRQPINIPLASARAEGLGWRWVEARTVDDAVSSYADVQGLIPAQRKAGRENEPSPPSKAEKARRYVSERIVDPPEGAPPLPLDVVHKDYAAWHQDEYGAPSDGLLAKRSFNAAMKKAGLKPRIGEARSRKTLNHAALAKADRGNP